MLSKTSALIQQQFAGFLIAIGMLFGLFPGTTLATDLIHTTVPASACQPLYNDAHLIRMVNAAWAFRKGETGRATLYCPLPIHSSEFLPNDRSIDNIRIFYKDSDGPGAQASVKVRLMHRNFNPGGIFNTGPEWDSNTINSPSDDEDYRIEFHGIDRTLNKNRIYSFRVNLERVSEGESPVFTGIDFRPFPPQ